jgi:hypothetical protein
MDGMHFGLVMACFLTLWWRAVLALWYGNVPVFFFSII